MLANEIEGKKMTFEKDHITRITRLETIIESINETLKDLKSNQKDLANDIKLLRSEVWSQTKWILGFIFLILGSPLFTALLSKISAWVKMT
jgi:hypothetical protein